MTTVTFVRFVRLLRSIIAPALFLALAIVAAVPWGLPAPWQLLPYAFPAAVLLAINLQGEVHVPAVVTFAGGIGLDALGEGPLGYWALVYLVTYALTACAVVVRGVGAVQRWALAIFVLAATGCAAYAIAALYGASLPDEAPFLRAFLVVAVLHPMLVLLLRPLSGRSTAAPRSGGVFP